MAIPIRQKNSLNNLIKIQRYTVIGSGILLLIKCVAYFITESNAILSDTLESVVNLLAGMFALYSISMSAKPKDRDHPYGHGKIEFISASFEGALIIAAGVFIIGKSVYNFFNPYDIHDLDLGMALTLFAGIVNFIMGRVLIVSGRKNRSMSMEADGKHLMSDAWSTLGMLIGLILVYLTDFIWIDNLMALLFGLIIIVTGIKILKKSLAAIMDEADMELLEDLIQILNEKRNDEWVDLHNFRALKYGSHIHVDCHLTLPFYYDLSKAHEQLDAFDRIVQEKYADKVESFTHMDPCRPSQCSLCQLKNCSERKEEFKQRMTWTLDNVLLNKRQEM